MATLFVSSTTARTGAISAAAVISATGLLATPAEATDAHAAAAPHVGATAHTTDLAHAPQTIDRHITPTAAPTALSAITTVPAAVPAAVAATTHTVKRGDTVWDLARRYGSTVTAIADANGLDARATIHVGQRLSIPHAGPSKPAASSATHTKAPTSTTGTHTVKVGDTVWDLAQRYGSSVHAIVAANGLDKSATIHIGDTLAIPGGGAATSASKSSSASGSTKSTKATASSRYSVKSGDTLASIAKRFGATTKTLAGANGIANPSLIRVGQVLTIPGGVPTGLVGDTFAGRTYSKSVVGAANTNKATLNAASVPSRAAMRSLIAKTAKAYGVDTSLALAIGYQESGFNMRAVSPANAVGVMQVIPATGEWISTVVGRELDLLDPNDNVTAGVVLLKYLTQNASSLDQAIAGYYQGLGGVRKNGMNADTVQYVTSVKSLIKKFD